MSAPTEKPAAIPTQFGAPFAGGLYAGISIHDNQPVALILLPGDESLTWPDAMAWAEKQGGVLPSRIDLLVMLKTVKSEFKPDWYWSGEQHADGSAYAWYQHFGTVYQHYWLKGDKTRARAVRRVPI